jgi:phosphate transport system ATP-binding protein
MNDLVRGFRCGRHLAGDICSVDRPKPGAAHRDGFQQPNPFATSIFNNVAFGLRLANARGEGARVEAPGAPRSGRGE